MKYNIRFRPIGGHLNYFAGLLDDYGASRPRLWKLDSKRESKDLTLIQARIEVCFHKFFTNRRISDYKIILKN